MPRPSKRVIRAVNIPLVVFPCLLVAGITAGIRDMFCFHPPFHPLFVWMYVIFVFVVRTLLVSMFLVAAWRVWNQKYVFDEDFFRFKNEQGKQEIRYNHVVEVRLHLTLGGFHNQSSRLLSFKCRNRQPNILWHDAFDFSLRSTLKVLTELCRRTGLKRIAISSPSHLDNERELRRVAKGLGQISFDESNNRFWFTPHH